MAYIAGPKEEHCVFCQKPTTANDAAEHLVLRGEFGYIALNRYPYNNGHLLITPYAHVASVEDLPLPTLTELMVLVNHSLAALRLAMRPDGFNVGINLGKPAGAGIESHVHIHVVPRWSGDTSFLSAIADTRIIPEGLDQSYNRICAALATVLASQPAPAEPPAADFS